jgi:hypothetical protein
MVQFIVYGFLFISQLIFLGLEATDELLVGGDMVAAALTFSGF